MSSLPVIGASTGGTLVERLTASFYSWEQRGRGWIEAPEWVRLEPPFTPFPGHVLVGGPLPDDARKPTAISAFVERLLGGGKSPPVPDVEEEEDLEEAEPDLDRDQSPCRELGIFVPAETRVTAEVSAQLLVSLRGSQLPIAFEILGNRDRLALQVAVRDSDASLVDRQIRSLFPETVCTPSGGVLEGVWGAAGPWTAVVEFGLSREFMLPIRRATRLDPDPLAPLFGALSELGPDECGVLQMLFEPARQPWAESVARAVTDGRGRPFFLDAPELTKLALEKVSQPLYAAVLRLGVRSQTEEGLLTLARATAAPLAAFGAPGANELIPLAAVHGPSVLEEDLLKRRSHRAGMLLSVEELASLVHLPSPAVRVPKLARESPRTKAAPSEATREGVILGQNAHRGETATVRLPLPARLRHTHLVGASGTGKTTLLAELILQDVDAGHGLCLIDPHGDLVEELLGRIGEGQGERVVLVDPGDTDYVIGFNPLQAHSEAERQLLASDLVGIFRRLSTSWGDQMHSVFANAIQAFLESETGGTLLDLRRFLVEPSFREHFLATVRDSEVRYFWEREFPLLSGRPQAPILTRLDAFLRPKVLRAMVGSRESRLDLHAALDERQVVLVKLAQGVIGEENAALLGSFLVSKLHQAALARQTVSPEARQPFYLYLDEFQEFVTPSLAGLLSGARKFGVGLVLAHQSLGQVKTRSPEVLDAVLSNAYTQICFRVGEADARTLERGLSFFEARDLQSLGVGEAIVRVGRADQDFTLSVPALPPADIREAERLRELHRAESRSRYGTRRESEAPEARAPAVAPVTQEHEGSTKPKGRYVEVANRLGDEMDPLGERSATPPVLGAEETAPVRVSAGGKQVLDKAELDCLHLVAVEPFLAVRERNRRLGFSAWKGHRVKSALIGAGFVKEVAVNPGGRGKRFKLLELTQAGRGLLGHFRIAPSSGHGRGGIVHQWWAHTIATWLEERGVPAEIEDASSGARVDLSFTFAKKSTAVELEMGEGHAAENIRKDLAAGFDRVVCLFDDASAAERIQSTLGSENEASPSEVILGPLRDFETVLKPHTDTESSASLLRRPKQEEEPKRRRRSRDRRPPPLAAPVSPSPRDAPPDASAFSTPDAAEYLGLSPATLETMRSRGGGPAFVKLGRRVIYRREDLDRWLEENRRASTSSEKGGR